MAQHPLRLHASRLRTLNNDKRTQFLSLRSRFGLLFLFGWHWLDAVDFISEVDRDEDEVIHIREIIMRVIG